jgi:hypothetical protein
MHIHLGAGEFFRLSLYFILFGFLWRLIASCLSDTAIGRAMAFIF